MKLILARHGLAMEKKDFEQRGQDDSLRPLVAKGRERSKLTAKWLKESGLDLDMIVTSPFVRARETANIYADHLKISNLFEAPELRPKSAPNLFAQWLKIHADECSTVMAVGHEPHLGLLASWCLLGKTEEFFNFKKSGLLCLSVNNFSELRPGTAKLDFLISPKQIESEI